MIELTTITTKIISTGKSPISELVKKMEEDGFELSEIHNVKRISHRTTGPLGRKIQTSDARQADTLACSQWVEKQIVFKKIEKTILEEEN